MKRFIVLALAATFSSAAFAQDWQSCYIGGLNAAKDRNWSDARIDFQEASKSRPGDAPSISLSGSVFEQEPWRHGAPYSPDFLAAYCGLKEAIAMPAGDTRTTLLSQVKAEFENLLGRREYCPELFFFLDETYVLTSLTDKRVALGRQYSEIGSKATWKVDSAGIAPEDVEMVAELPSSSQTQTAGPATTAITKPQRQTPLVVVAPNTDSAQPRGTKPPVNTSTASLEANEVVVIQMIPTSDGEHESQIPQTIPAPSLTEGAPPSVPSQTAPTGPSPSHQDVKSQTSTTDTAKPTVVQPPVEKPAAAPIVVVTPTTAAQSGKPIAVPNTDSASSQTAVPKAVAPRGSEPATIATVPAISPQGQTPGQTVPDAKPVDKHNRRKKVKKDSAQATTDDTAVIVTPNQPGDHANQAAPTAIVKPVSVKALTHLAKGSLVPSGAVPPEDTKFAIVIGNAESKMDGGSIPYASDDAQTIRKALISDAGYLDSHVEVVIDATAAQIADSVNALASRVSDKGTVFIYFTGVGTNVDGKDYLAGVDSDASNDSSTMIAKDDVYKAFMVRGARVFAFFQTNRPLAEGHYFGSEVPMVGSISQMEATLPGQAIYAVNSDGKQVGLFTEAFTSVLKDIRSNQTPIMDFGWQVFYKLRSGGTGSEGGSSNQSPSLPVLTNMTNDARF